MTLHNQLKQLKMIVGVLLSFSHKTVCLVSQIEFMLCKRNRLIISQISQTKSLKCLIRLTPRENFHNSKILRRLPSYQYFAGSPRLSLHSYNQILEFLGRCCEIPYFLFIQFSDVEIIYYNTCGTRALIGRVLACFCNCRKHRIFPVSQF